LPGEEHAEGGDQGEVIGLKAELTSKELEIARRYVLGNAPLKVIAGELLRAAKTVEKHVQRIYGKMGREEVHNQLGMAKWLVRHGYVRVDELFPGTYAEC
jgi:DNA-binding NarL/FixJ family response regulator